MEAADKTEKKNLESMIKQHILKTPENKDREKMPKPELSFPPTLQTYQTMDADVCLDLTEDSFYTEGNDDEPTNIQQ